MSLDNLNLLASLAADASDGNGLQFESVCVFKLFPRVFKKIDFYSCSLISIRKLRLYPPLDVQR